MRYFYIQKLAHITSTHIPLSKRKSQVHAKGLWEMYSHFAQEGGENMEIDEHQQCLLVYS